MDPEDGTVQKCSIPEQELGSGADSERVSTDFRPPADVDFLQNRAPLADVERVRYELEHEEHAELASKRCVV